MSTLLKFPQPETELGRLKSMRADLSNALEHTVRQIELLNDSARRLGSLLTDYDLLIAQEESDV